MYRDGFNSTFSALYFVVLVVFGAFFMVNLFFAVMWEQFSSIADIQSRKVRAGLPCREFGYEYDNLVCQVDASKSTLTEERVLLLCCAFLEGNLLRTRSTGIDTFPR